MYVWYVMVGTDASCRMFKHPRYYCSIKFDTLAHLMKTMTFVETVSGLYLPLAVFLMLVFLRIRTTFPMKLNSCQKEDLG